jgi:hypothetical protein
MRRPLAPMARRPLLLAILVAILAISVVYSASVRRAFLMSELQFIPVEDELLLVTGDVESLWEGVAHHFGSVFLEEGEDVGALTRLFRKAREGLQEREIEVTSPDDLVQYGFYPGRGLLLSANHLYSGNPGFLAVLPVAERDTFTQFLSDRLDLDMEEGPDLGLEDAQVFSLEGEAYLAQARTGPALLALDSAHLRRSLLYRDRNLAHASSDDELYRVVREHLQGSLGSGPTLFGWWRPLARPGIRRMTGVMTLHPDAVRLGVEVKVEAGILRVLDDFLLPAAMNDEWHRFLGPETAAAIGIENEALSNQLRFMRRSETIRNFMDDRYGGVLQALEEIPGLRRAVLAVTGYRDGLPELLLGVWADPDSLERLVRDVQLRQREKRDRAVLEGALDSLLSLGDETLEEEWAASGRIPLEVLERAGLLVPEEGSTFHRYRVRVDRFAARLAGGASEPGLLADTTALIDQDLSSERYLLEHESQTIRLVLPPVTDNDIAYVPGLAEVDGEALRGDRYRLATVVLDSVLWVATDVDGAREQIDRVEASRRGEDVSDLADNEAFQAARTTWSRWDRIQGFLDIERLATLGLLSPESQVEEAARELLLDFRNHPAVSLSIRSDRRGELIVAELTALLQRGGRDR